MNNYIGIVRSDERLQRAEERLKVIHEETERLYKTTTLSPQLGELRNMINVSWLIIRQSMQQKENRGTFLILIWCDAPGPTSLSLTPPVEKRSAWRGSPP